MKLCTLHTTDKFMELMSDPFTKPFLADNPDVELTKNFQFSSML